MYDKIKKMVEHAAPLNVNDLLPEPTTTTTTTTITLALAFVTHPTSSLVEVFLTYLLTLTST